jgi:hypothetical protein
MHLQSECVAWGAVRLMSRTEQARGEYCRRAAEYRCDGTIVCLVTKRGHQVSQPWCCLGITRAGSWLFPVGFRVALAPPFSRTAPAPAHLRIANDEHASRSWRRRHDVYGDFSAIRWE